MHSHSLASITKLTSLDICVQRFHSRMAFSPDSLSIMSGFTKDKFSISVCTVPVLSLLFTGVRVCVLYLDYDHSLSVADMIYYLAEQA